MTEFPRPALPVKASLAVFNSAKLAVAEWMGPKSFRIETGLAWLLEQAFSGGSDDSFWWVGPDYGSCANAISIVQSALTPGSFTVPGRSSSIVLISGSSVLFRNAENPNMLYSETIRAAAVDRAIDITEKSWNTLRDSLANTRAPVRILSTVAGRDNWFHELCRRAETEQNTNPDLHYERFSALDALEEDILTQADIDYARATLPDHIFRALYLAQPYDDRVESAHRQSDPRLMSDAELAIIAGLDPSVVADISNSQLEALLV